VRVEVKPTENIDILAENLEARTESVRKEKDRLIVETEKTDILEKTPGIKEFKINEEAKKGIGGRPVDKQAYARLESREDAVKCLLATIKGYDIRVLDTEREWDLRQLRKFNPDIKHLKTERPQEFLGIKYSLFESENTEKVDIEMPEQEDLIKIYRELLA